MATSHEEVGTRIRLARERKHWSQQQLATACGVDVKTVRNWEQTGRIRNRRGAIEEALGISLDHDTPPAAGPSASEAIANLRRQLEELQDALNREHADDETNGGRRAG